MAVFTVARGGLMYEATIGGQKFSCTPREEAKQENQPSPGAGVGVTRQIRSAYS